MRGEIKNDSFSYHLGLKSYFKKIFMRESVEFAHLVAGRLISISILWTAKLDSRTTVCEDLLQNGSLIDTR